MYALILLFSLFVSGIGMSFLGAFSYWYVPALFALRYLHVRSVPQALFPPTYVGLSIGVILFSQISLLVPVLLWTASSLLPQVVDQLLRAVNGFTQNLFAIGTLYLIYGVTTGGLSTIAQVLVGYILSIVTLAGVGFLPFFDRERGGFRVAI